MKIGIFGAGALGGFLGAKLAASGEDVHFVARDNKLKAMRLNGLTVKSEALGNVYIPKPQVTDDPEEIGACDVVFFTVKLYQTDEAIALLSPMIGAGTILISFQNGLTAHEPLMKAFGPEMVLGGVAYTMAYSESPGVIQHLGHWARFIIGRFEPGATARGEAMEEAAPQLRAEAIKDVLIEAGLEAEVSDDIRVEIWKKFAYLAPLSGMAALRRQPLGDLLADPDSKKMLEDAILEVIQVSRARGLQLDAALKGHIMTMFDAMPPEMGTSALVDMIYGNRLEVPWLSGAVSRFGHEKNVPTPMHDAIATALKPWS